jgi:hypothetical protein
MSQALNRRVFLKAAVISAAGTRGYAAAANDLRITAVCDTTCKNMAASKVYFS